VVSILILYYIFINLYGLYIMHWDKSKAIHKKRRIPEAALWQVALIGGGVGLTTGMFLFRHKTKHLSFRIGLPSLALLSLILFSLLFSYLVK
jgi:uncharacterized membrane protein YsdA (DUF1294 family)